MYVAGVIGAIDGCHINIKAPAENSNAYINRKGQHSMILQAVCTSEMKFIDCYAGEVGSVHDATVLKRSDLFERMSTDPHMFPTDSHIIGDAAYPLLKNLMVPYKDTGSLSARQHRFNVSLSSSRCVIERAFAFLKGRFRRLKMLDMSRVDLIPKVIIACCILHNICLTTLTFWMTWTQMKMTTAICLLMTLIPLLMQVQQIDSLLLRSATQSVRVCKQT